jgi:homoserine kinase
VESDFDVPRDRSNLLVSSFESLHPADGFCFRIGGDIPLGRGMGSSASAIVAGLMAADHLFELGLTRQELLIAPLESCAHKSLDYIIIQIFK